MTKKMENGNTLKCISVGHACKSHMNESIRILGLESIQDIRQKKKIFGGKGCYNEKHAPYLKNFLVHK